MEKTTRFIHHCMFVDDIELSAKSGLLSSASKAGKHIASDKRRLGVIVISHVAERHTNSYMYKMIEQALNTK